MKTKSTQFTFEIKFFVLFTFLFSIALFGQNQGYIFTGGNFNFQFPPDVSTSTISALSLIHI